jgi:hypothetical protein
LERDGWAVGRDWPTFFAVRDGEVRLIIVKPNGDGVLSDQEEAVKDALDLIPGVEVEVMQPLDFGIAIPDPNRKRLRRRSNQQRRDDRYFDGLAKQRGDGF